MIKIGKDLSKFSVKSEKPSTKDELTSIIENRMRKYGNECDLNDIDLKNPAREVARYILSAHRENDGDILAFLPGEAAIRRCAELLEGNLGGTGILPANIPLRNVELTQ